MSRNAGSLQKAIRQQRPFESAGQEIVLGLMRTTDVMRRVFNEVYEPHGITSPQYNVLRILRGTRPDGLPTLAIRERMVERTPGVTRLIDRLEARGWVERETPKSDRRQVICRITTDGLKFLEGLDGPVRALAGSAANALSEKDQHKLISLLDTLRVSHEPTADGTDRVAAKATKDRTQTVTARGGRT